MHVDHLSFVIMLLVGFVSLCVSSFSWRYLAGDRRKGYFYTYLICMVLAVFIMVAADHILLLLIAWMASQWFLTRLMLHKREWRAAQCAANLTRNYFVFAFFLLALGLAVTYLSTGETSIQAIIRSSSMSKSAVFWSSFFIVLAVMIQSSLWPFHRWLLSSLNSPTPVSAIMHAGLVNGGGFLCARFSTMLANDSLVLHILFITGIASALIGTIWKLVQPDIKRMLACSTLAQMGFMLAQCGLGLFSAAVAHLCCHGLFKAYLFLSSGSAAQEKRLDLGYPPCLTTFLLALATGLLGAIVFAFSGHKDMLAGDTSLFLVVIAWVAGTQLALPMIRMRQYAFALCLIPVIAFFYGKSVYGMEVLLYPLNNIKPQDIAVDHCVGLGLLITAWLGILFIRRPKKGWSDWILKIYVYLLNTSQPSPQTITAHRQHYHY